MSQLIPQYVLEFNRQCHALAATLNVPTAPWVTANGLYIGLRTHRDPINTNRKRRHVTVRLRRDGVEIFRSEEVLSTFPTDHLITQLMLVK